MRTATSPKDAILNTKGQEFRHLSQPESQSNHLSCAISALYCPSAVSKAPSLHITNIKGSSSKIRFSIKMCFLEFVWEK